MALRRNLKSTFFRPPRRRAYYWLPTGLGGVILALSAAAVLVGDPPGPLLDVGPEFSLLGLGLTAMGGAELLPVDRQRLAALFRFVAVGGFVTWWLALALTF